MKIIEGKYASAKVFSDTAEDYALAQIKMLCDNDVFKESQVRVMPDVHPGKVGPIGFTATFEDKIIPYVIGSDIGCGVSVCQVLKKKIEYQRLDNFIRDKIPVGHNIRSKPHELSDINFSELYCEKAINKEIAELSIGTLGGGNHFIEIDQCEQEDDYMYITVHSGSRNLGKMVTDHYLQLGQKDLKEKGILDVPYELTWLEEDLMKQYIHDVGVVSYYAYINRRAIINDIIKHMKLKFTSIINTAHNYITEEDEYNEDAGVKILRKGAIAAYQGYKIIIPINMKDGIIIGEGLGNRDWNFSAPHGAGRIMNRTDVKSNFTVSQFKSEMKGIHCTCIGKDTLDEAPFAYRGIDEIKEAISETVRIDKILKPVYNYKAGSKEK